MSMNAPASLPIVHYEHAALAEKTSALREALLLFFEYRREVQKITVRLRPQSLGTFFEAMLKELFFRYRFVMYCYMCIYTYIYIYTYPNHSCAVEGAMVRRRVQSLALVLLGQLALLAHWPTGCVVPL